jgi:hypothetical protein
MAQPVACRLLAGMGAASLWRAALLTLLLASSPCAIVLRYEADVGVGPPSPGPETGPPPGGPAGDWATEEERASNLDVDANPAGCNPSGTKASIEELGGVYPLEEFKHMLETRKGTIWYNNSKSPELSEKLNVPWCPTPLTDSPFDKGDDETFHLLERELAGVAKSDPLVVIVIQLFGRPDSSDFHLMQTSNFMCGMKRLGIAGNVVAFPLEEATATVLKKQFPDLRMPWHPSLTHTIAHIAKRTNIGYQQNRIAKLVVASMLVEKGYEVILSDLDMYWSQNPAGYLRSLKTPSGTAVEFAAMRDVCWLELNSGFLYYRSTENTKSLLRNALSTVKFETSVNGLGATIVSDNDQYLLNCALARSALDGLNYAILPRASFLFGRTPLRCRPAPPPNVQAPLVWHTAGFTGRYESEFDMFAAAGILDLDPGSGRCLEAVRGAAADLSRFNDTWSRLCLTGPAGIVGAACDGGCAGEPRHAAEALRRYKGSWKVL